MTSVCASQVRSMLKVASVEQFGSRHPLNGFGINAWSGRRVYREQNTTVTLILLQLINIRFSEGHWTASLAACWRGLSVASVWHTSHSILPPMYSYV